MNREEHAMFCVKYVAPSGQVFFMKGTIFTSAPETRSTYDTQEAAQAAINKAAKFSRPTMVKKWKIVSA